MLPCKFRSTSHSSLASSGDDGVLFKQGLSRSRRRHLRQLIAGSFFCPARVTAMSAGIAVTTLGFIGSADRSLTMTSVAAQDPAVEVEVESTPGVDVDVDRAPADDSGPAVRGPAAGGDAAQVSTWAQAGLLWSDAHFARRVALDAAKLSDNPGQQAEMEAVAARCDRLIDSLEEFGWTRVRQVRAAKARAVASNAAETRGGEPRAAEADAAVPPQDVREASAGEDETDVPSAEAAGLALADELSLPPNKLDPEEAGDSPAGDPDSVPETVLNPPSAEARIAASKPPLEPSVSPEPLPLRVETETPSGREDPGVDDELSMDPEKFDISQYRVDDHIDETFAERINRADAIEDGAEAALAAGVDTIGPDVAGRISERETQTRSATLPYSRDSIYDSDDYDPDIDYDAENPIAAQAEPVPAGPSGSINDGYDGVDDIDGEDELVQSMAGVEQTKVPLDRPVDDPLRGTPPTALARGTVGVVTPEMDAEPDPEAPVAPNAAPVAPAVDWTAYSLPDVRVDEDADWVQLHLEKNQQRFDRLQDRLPAMSAQSLRILVGMAVIDLRASAAAITEDASADPRLAKLLDEFE